MFKYDPPGKIDDLENRPTRAAFLENWHDWILAQIREEITNLTKYDKVPYPLFFSEVDDPAKDTDLPVPWNAYPLALQRALGSNPGAWSRLDTLRERTGYTPDGASPVRTKYRPQDEYCEWHRYDHGPRGPRIVFTAEGPEYWILLAQHDLDRVVELYKMYVSPDVKKQDLLLEQDIVFGIWLLPAGTYNPFNKWNTELGAMHLTHYANTLGAEINLAARATVLRRDMQGRRIVDSRRLIASSGFGSSNRSSDPNIGFGVNVTAVPDGSVKPVSITLANPVGLYMDECAEAQLTDQDGTPLIDWFKFVRGTKGHGLMAVLEPPEGDTRTLDDVYVGGEKLESGAQVAKHIQMVIYAATADLKTPMSPLQAPIYRACVPEGTDLTNLSKINFDSTDSWTAADSCRAQGAAHNPPIALDDAYPELFETSTPEMASAVTRRMTRNG